MKRSSRIVAFLLLVVLSLAGMAATYKDVIKNVDLGLDLQGGFEVLCQVDPSSKGDKIGEKALQSTAQTLEDRVDVLGASEPKIQVGEPNRARIQLAGVTDQNEARKVLSSQANLAVRDAEDKVKLSDSDIKQGSTRQEFKQETNQSTVTFKVKDKNKFKKITEEISEKRDNVMAVWLDSKKDDNYKKETQEKNPRFISAANVDQPINSDSVEVSGGSKGQEGVRRAEQIAELLNAGSLPISLKETYSNSVGAQFGQDALDKAVFASLIGVALIYLSMLGLYRLPGLVAIIALTTYIYLTLVAFDFISGVLTLPGLAALVLDVGMAVNASIVVYERIKGELRIGRTIRQAFPKTNRSSFLIIFDFNLTTVIATTVSFFFGESSAKDFATMLLLGILMIFATAMSLSGFLLSSPISPNMFKSQFWLLGVKKNKWYDINEDADIHDLKTSFEKWNLAKLTKPLIGVSILIVVVGLVILYIFKLNLGTDFSSGTRIDFQPKQAITQRKVEQVAKDNGPKTDQIQVNSKDNKVATVQFKDDLTRTQDNKLNDNTKPKSGDTPQINTVSPVIGQELAKNTIFALIYASIGITIYVPLRSEWRMGLSSVLTLLCDMFIIVTTFSLFRIEVGLTFITAVLAIVGYPINDIIVTFDRVREDLQKVKVITTTEQIDDIVNRSIRQTMTRLINTVLTITVVVVAILLFGAPTIFNFTLALFIGLISGVSSSIFIAVPLWGTVKRHRLEKSPKHKLVVYREKKSNDEKILV